MSEKQSKQNYRKDIWLNYRDQTIKLGKAVAAEHTEATYPESTFLKIGLNYIEGYPFEKEYWDKSLTPGQSDSTSSDARPDGYHITHDPHRDTKAGVHSYQVDNESEQMQVIFNVQGKDFGLSKYTVLLEDIREMLRAEGYLN